MKLDFIFENYRLGGIDINDRRGFYPSRRRRRISRAVRLLLLPLAPIFAIIFVCLYLDYKTRTYSWQSMARALQFELWLKDLWRL